MYSNIVLLHRKKREQKQSQQQPQPQPQPQTQSEPQVQAQEQAQAASQEQAWPQMPSQSLPQQADSPCQENVTALLSSIPILRWETCLRELIFSSHELLQKIFEQDSPSPSSSVSPSVSSATLSAWSSQFDIYQGEDAYRLILEIICGLHSPLLGETEVFGQFKNIAQNWDIPRTPWGHDFKRILKSLMEDAKRIRAEHLVGLGSQSYGSLLRRELRNHNNNISELHIVGAGHLTSEILPWLVKESWKIYIHVRDLIKCEKLQNEWQQYPQVQFLQITSNHQSAVMVTDVTDATDAACRALIVAAPVTAEWVTSPSCSFAASQLWSCVYDLRGGICSDEQRLTGLMTTNLFELESLMKKMSELQGEQESRRHKALQAVRGCLHHRQQSIEYRPFGWEDLCA